MKAVALVLSIEVIPFAVLISCVLASPLSRRSRFWWRLIGIAVVMVIPDLVALLARPGENTSGMLVWLGLGWGMLLAASSRFVLFHGGGLDPGPGDDGGGGPDSGDDRPTPPAPISGLPLPDAEPSSVRLRDHRPQRRPWRPRRPARRPERVLS
jgi:hypothetical protein